LSHEDFKRLIETTWLTTARSNTESAVNMWNKPDLLQIKPFYSTQSAL